MQNNLLINIAAFRNRLDQKLGLNSSLVFLLLVVTQHSFLLRFAGLFLVLLLNLDLLFQVRPARLPLFYLVLPGMELIRFFFLDRDYSPGHLAMFSVGMIYWLSAFLVCALLYRHSQYSDPGRMHRSIGLYTVLNFIVSLMQYIRICIAEGVLNPYDTGHDHPYGISSGDLIHGLPGDVHLVNAFVCLLLVLYYMERRQLLLLLLALLPLLATGSNYAAIILLAGVGLQWLCSRQWRTLKYPLIVTGVSLLFYVSLTRENAQYLSDKLMQQLFHRPIPAEEQLYGAEYQEQSGQQAGLSHHIHLLEEPGKRIAYRQTLHYLGTSWMHLFLGAGMGGFSSKLAFNFSGVMDQSSIGKYLPHYETPEFRAHHKAIYAELKELHVIMHSESNRPFSTYNQLLGEYGLLGLLCFLFLYLGYFLRRMSWKGYAPAMVFCLLLMLHLDYYIEALNLLLFFELLLFIDIRAKNERIRA